MVSVLYIRLAMGTYFHTKSGYHKPSGHWHFHFGNESIRLLQTERIGEEKQHVPNFLRQNPKTATFFFFLFEDILLKMQLYVFFIDKSHVKILTPYTKPPKMKLKLQNLHCNHHRHSSSLRCPRNICYFLLGKNMLFVTSLYPEAVKVFHSFLTLMWQISCPFLVPTKSCPMLLSLIV